jgi:probable F420-dependent oxidoreductase
MPMRIGFFLPQIGPAATVDSITKVATLAEELGYDSLWVTDRLLYPTNPQTSYYGGPLPEVYKRVFDPLETLTFAAAHTRRVTLGTSVLDIPFYNPVVLGRQLTTLDVLSAGRLRVGLGLGWSKDEYDATGTPVKIRGKRADEFIAVLKAIWTTDPAEFHGRYFQLPKSIIQPKPAQKPHPPIYLAAYSPGAMKRTAKFADGFMPVGMPLEQVKSTITQLRNLAKDAGRNLTDLKLILRYNFAITPEPQGKDRPFFHGTFTQIKDDIASVKGYGPDELILDPTFSPDTQNEQSFIRNMEQIRKLL